MMRVNRKQLALKHAGQKMAFVGRLQADNYNNGQIIGFMMMRYNIFYETAKKEFDILKIK